MFLSCVTASAAFVAVEFGGQITGSSIPGFPTGARVTGYFTYHSERPADPQTDVRPNFVFEIHGNGFRFESSSYAFRVYNNWGESALRDGFALEFSFYYPQGGYGAFLLLSSNTALFSNNQLPPTIPALEQFDADRVLYVTIDQVQPYTTMVTRIDRLSLVPGSGLGRPSIFDVRRTAAGLSLRFLTEPATGYAVQVAGSLREANWLTVTNLSSTTEPVATISDAASGMEQRFYRIRKNPN